MKRSFVLLGAVASLLAAGVALAQAPSTEAEVRRIDTAHGKITLKHGPIANLQLPAMTLVFRVADPAMLTRVKAGDTVNFSAEKIEGQYTITSIEAK